MAGSRHRIAGKSSDLARGISPQSDGLLTQTVTQTVRDDPPLGDQPALFPDNPTPAPAFDQNPSDGSGDTSADTPHAGHRARLRERFLAAPNALPDYELLEILLTACLPRIDTKPLAKALLDDFGDIGEVLSAPIEKLIHYPRKGRAKLGPTSAAMLKAIGEAGIRMTRLKILHRPIISAWDQLLDYCNVTMAREPIEQFRVLFLDRKNALIADELHQRGTIDFTPVYPREVLKRALELNAANVIIVHNHPSGDPTPSKADIEMTKQVRDALRAAGITLHDHLIIGRRGHTSFKSNGLL